MSATVLDGKAVAARRRTELADKVRKLSKQPKLGVILATDNPATLAYVERKRKAAEEVGYAFFVEKLGPTATEGALIETCRRLNADDTVTAYIPQMPMPEGVDAMKVIAGIDPGKDADGLTPANLGYLFIKQERIVPATPQGILTLLESYRIEVTGRNVTVVGKSLLVGWTIATLLAHRGATVTSCDSKTRDLAAETVRADILIAAVGKPGLITGKMVKPGATVIDVGITRVDERLKGDVDFDSVAAKAGAITPVPGGVGPMTVVSLLENVYKLQQAAG